MDRTDCAYLINTTPKYFYLLNLHITLLQRYAPSLAWPVYLATEAPELLGPLPKVTILTLPKNKSGFFESREAAVAMLPDTIKYVFPIQEDFLLEGRPMTKEITEALNIFDYDPTVMSIRLMPCPGPHALDKSYNGGIWKILDFDMEMVFTYQATLWRRAPYQTFMKSLLHKTEHLNEKQKIVAAIKVNMAEIAEGQMLLRKCLNPCHSVVDVSQQAQLHLAFPRSYPHPNAVYLCPWPYRPTAVVRGILEPWASELAQRELVPLEASLLLKGSLPLTPSA
jgi:hypothetical protein